MKPEPGYNGGDQVVVRCGVCKECRQRRQALWVGRMLLEQREHQAMHFVTLTYGDDHVVDLETGYRDVQLFLKKLRKRLSDHRFRFFCCGEHGSKYGRPHWHIVLFTDLQQLRALPGKDGVTWDTLGLPPPKFIRPVDLVTELWGRGYTKTERIIDDVKLRYVTKYMVKEPTRARFTYSQGLGAARAFKMGKQVGKYTNQAPLYLKLSSRSYPIAGSTRRAFEDGIVEAGRLLPPKAIHIDRAIRNQRRAEAAERRTDGEKEEGWSRFWFNAAKSEESPRGSAELRADICSPAAFHPGYPEIPGRQEGGPACVTREESDAYTAKSDGCFDWPDHGTEARYSERPSYSKRGGGDAPSVPFPPVSGPPQEARSLARGVEPGVSYSQQPEPL